MIFENSQVNLSELPSIESVSYKKLDPASLRVSYIGTTIFFAILGVIISFVFIFSDLWLEHRLIFSAAITVWFLWLLLSMFLVSKQYHMQGYALREKDILHKRGVIFHSMVAIPFNRVQHCEIKQGPIERMFDLKTLEIFTAGGQSSDLSISGLKSRDAQLMKEYIVNNTGQDEHV